VCSAQLAEAATAAASPQQLSSHAYFIGIKGFELGFHRAFGLN